MKANRTWITWEKHRRTTELVSALGSMQLIELGIEANALIRYPYLLLQTLSILISQRPSLVIVQNPSVVLAFFVVTIGRALTKRVVVDSHNEGLRPYHANHKWLLPLYRIIQGMSDLTIVTNANLANEVKENGGRAFVLEDRIPHFEGLRRIKLRGKYNITFVCTFEKDEPYMEVIRSAALIDPSISIYVTGRHEKALPELSQILAPNIVFTGFLSDEDYKNLLFSSDAIMDLTLMDDCLVCGAYEAVAVGKPLILSDTIALRSYFNKGAAYTENKAVAIASAIRYVLQKRVKLEKEITSLKTRLERNWDKKLAELTALLDDLQVNSDRT